MEFELKRVVEKALVVSANSKNERADERERIDDGMFFDEPRKLLSYRFEVVQLLIR